MSATTYRDTLNPPQRCIDCNSWTGAVGLTPVRCATCLMVDYYRTRKRGVY